LTVIGLDTNILCYALDPALKEHDILSGLFRDLSPKLIAALNPTVLHETYHTLVYHQMWERGEARGRLGILLRHPHIEFFNQTKHTSFLAMSLAEKYGLGGRDSLILANFLANRVTEMQTHDSGVLKLGAVSWKGRKMKLVDPVVSR